MRASVIALVTLWTLGFVGIAMAEEPLFPFVISYDSPNNVTNISTWLPRPAGKQGFVRDHDGRFATDAGPIRFWATNMVAEGCVPTHEQAERVAARIARLGINCVRIHHLDCYPIWGKSPNKLTIDPERLDRLDYLIYQLKLRGVYTNLNLHVSRSLGAAEGFPNPELRPEYDKGVGQFESRMIEVQKKYARDLLTHVNPYTKTAYTDEPAIAFVEISNEDGLIFEWGGRDKLSNLPEPYATTFRKLWNAWLRKTYGSTDRLRAAWNAGMTSKPGAEMLSNGDLSQPLDGHWRVDGDQQTKVDLSVRADAKAEGRRMLRLAVQQSGRADWAPILVHPGVDIRRGVIYTLTFQIRCESAQRCEVGTQMDHEPWSHVGLSTTVDVGPQWRPYSLIFSSDVDEPNARVVFSGFKNGAACELTNVSLRPGGNIGLEPGQRLEDDTVPTLKRQMATTPASCDFCDFLLDTERTYWHEMYRFLKDDLHVRSLVCGTQLGFSTPHVQAELDYVDNHAYWQHPQFPNRPWDMKDWYMDDVALVNRPIGTLVEMAVGRVAGKPYTVSEYNHPAPNSYSAEGFPMMASFGAFQNWDGIYSFAYSHGSHFEPQRIESFFDIKSHTAQLAHMPACAAMFLRGDVAGGRPRLFPFSQEDELRRVHEKRFAWWLTTRALLGDREYPLLHAVALDLADGGAGGNDQKEPTEGRTASAAGRLVSDTGEICLDVSKKKAGYYTVNTRRSKLFTGFVAGRTFSLGDVTLKVGPSRLDWATVSMVAVDGDGFDRPGRILIAATGWVQNRDQNLMRLEGTRITLGDKWGESPVMCEGIKATVTLPLPAGRAKCYPLDESGNRRAAIPVGAADGKTQVELDPRHKTVWYEIEIQPTGS
jgi:hypothetical protein